MPSRSFVLAVFPAPMAAPTPITAPQITPHKRGVVEDEYPMAGLRSFKAFTCRGYLVAAMQCPEYRAPETCAWLWELLNAADCCPEDHGPICPEAAARLRAVVQRNHVGLLEGRLSLLP